MSTQNTPTLKELIDELEDIFEPSIECMVEPFATRVTELFAALRQGVDNIQQEKEMVTNMLRRIDDRIKDFIHEDNTP